MATNLVVGLWKAKDCLPLAYSVKLSRRKVLSKDSPFCILTTRHPFCSRYDTNESYCVTPCIALVEMVCVVFGVQIHSAGTAWGAAGRGVAVGISGCGVQHHAGPVDGSGAGDSLRWVQCLRQSDLQTAQRREKRGLKMEIIAPIMIGLATTAVTALLGAFIRRFHFGTKSDAVMAEMKEELSELGKGQKVIFKLLLPLLLAARDGKTNGELKEALHLYNEYMQEK